MSSFVACSFRFCELSHLGSSSEAFELSTRVAELLDKGTNLNSRSAQSAKLERDRRLALEARRWRMRWQPWEEGNIKERNEWVHGTETYGVAVECGNPTAKIHSDGGVILSKRQLTIEQGRQKGKAMDFRRRIQGLWHWRLGVGCIRPQ